MLLHVLTLHCNAAQLSCTCPVQNGQAVRYMSHGVVKLHGKVFIDPSPARVSGILCSCCKEVISPSNFEAHAGFGTRRCVCSCSPARLLCLLL